MSAAAWLWAALGAAVLGGGAYLVVRSRFEPGQPFSSDIVNAGGGYVPGAITGGTGGADDDVDVAVMEASGTVVTPGRRPPTASQTSSRTAAALAASITARRPAASQASSPSQVAAKLAQRHGLWPVTGTRRRTL